MNPCVCLSRKLPRNKNWQRRPGRRFPHVKQDSRQPEKACRRATGSEAHAIRHKRHEVCGKRRDVCDKRRDVCNKRHDVFNKRHAICGKGRAVCHNLHLVFTNHAPFVINLVPFVINLVPFATNLVPFITNLTPLGASGMREMTNGMMQIAEISQVTRSRTSFPVFLIHFKPDFVRQSSGSDSRDRPTPGFPRPPRRGSPESRPRRGHA